MKKILLSVAAGERKSNFRSLTFWVSQLVPLLSLYNNTFIQGESLLTKKGDPQLVPVLCNVWGIPFGKRLYVCLILCSI